MYMDNQEIIDEIAIERNIKESTKDKYKIVLNHYSKFCGMTLRELLDEAEDEEEQRIRKKKRKIKRRLIDYRKFLFDNMLISTAKAYLSLVKTFYTHYEIELPILPKLNTLNVNDVEPLKYSDLLTKEIIKQVLDKGKPIMRAIVLFSISSGCANAETMSLTIHDFIEATSNDSSPYHNSNDIYEVIDLLMGREDIVPTFYMRRRKTNKYYYTFCSPEATQAILVYLANDRRKLVPEDKLFKIHPISVVRILGEMNDDLGLGKKGTYNRLRTHQFRKFHASNLKKSGMSMEDINSIQGKAKTAVNEAYFFDNPKQLKQIYIDHLDAVTINWNVHQLDMKSEEYRLLESELDKKNKEYDDLKDRIINIENAINNSMTSEELEIIEKYM